MTIIVAITDNREGRHAFTEAVAEAKLLATDLVAVNLGTQALDFSDIATDGVKVDFVDRKGAGKAKDKVERDAVEAVLHEVDERKATRLVIGVKRRSPVGKVILGSVSQRLLLNSPVPVLAVKLPEGELQSGSLDLPSGLRRVTG